MCMETVGIRELRQNASQVIEAAENGTTYRVTNHGKDTGVVITRQSHAAPPEQRTGATLEQIAKSGVYDQPRPAGYEQALLEIVERGRDEAGRIGNR
ncbi:type II toxin-antitoxin system Phd/YefM family antitoxin [Mycobacterium sp. 23]|uniref:type II toxin-antitoxin system Phd/YefM family antitoxin n=1 Tax=Mycobacterium sp. 23 TaxID=3400424 RepID=UPI003AAE3F70